MSDWVIYTGNLSLAIADLRSVDSECVTEEDGIVASLTPFVRDGNKAMAMVRSNSTQSDTTLNSVIALGNLQVLGCFYLGEFLETSPTALAIFENMRPKPITKPGLDGEDITITPPLQWAAFA